MDSRDGPGTGRLSNLAVFADVDNDGDLDIFDGAYISDTTEAVAAAKDRSEIFLNDGKGHFTMARAPRARTRRCRCCRAWSRIVVVDVTEGDPRPKYGK